jgi:hypothetical protein
VAPAEELKQHGGQPPGGLVEPGGCRLPDRRDQVGVLAVVPAQDAMRRVPGRNGRCRLVVGNAYRCGDSRSAVAVAVAR